MFYISYLGSELLRRKGRTVLTLAGLALGVALVIAISSLSRGFPRPELGVRANALFADEPTGNLDSTSGAGIIDLLADLGARHGTTIVVATHNAELASRAPRRLGMRDGQIAGPLVAATSKG